MVCTNTCDQDEDCREKRKKKLVVVNYTIAHSACTLLLFAFANKNCEKCSLSVAKKRCTGMQEIYATDKLSLRRPQVSLAKSV